MSTKLKTLPKGHRIIETAHGNYIQKQKQSRRRYKTPVATRRKIAAAARRFHVPVLSIAALSVGMADPVQMAIAGRWKSAWGNLVWNYTGWNIDTKTFRFSKLAQGWAPLLLVFAINRTGIAKPINQKLARAKIPLRLS